MCLISLLTVPHICSVPSTSQKGRSCNAFPLVAFVLYSVREITCSQLGLGPGIVPPRQRCIQQLLEYLTPTMGKKVQRRTVVIKPVFKFCPLHLLVY